MPTATYNVEDCTCGLDHDSIEHIAAMVILRVAEAKENGEYFSVGDIGAAIERSARKVGWVKTFVSVKDNDNE